MPRVESTPWKQTGFLQGRWGHPEAPGGLVAALRPPPSAPCLPAPPPSQQGPHSQAVHNSAPVPTLGLPLVHLGQQVQEGLLGVRRVPVRRPAQELEMPHQQVPLLQLRAQAASEGWGGGTDMSPGVTSRGSREVAPQPPPRFSPYGAQVTHPRDVLHPEDTGHQVFIHGARHKLHLHEAVLLPPRLWPVLQAGLGTQTRRGALSRARRGQLPLLPTLNLHPGSGAPTHPDPLTPSPPAEVPQLQQRQTLHRCTGTILTEQLQSHT